VFIDIVFIYVIAEDSTPQNNDVIVLNTQGRNKKTDVCRAAFVEFNFFGPTAASGGLNHLMRLSVRETFIEFCHRESFKIYTHCPSYLTL